MDKPIPIRIPPALAAQIDEAHAIAQRLGHSITKQDLMRDAMKLGLLELAAMGYDPVTRAHEAKQARLAHQPSHVAHLNEAPTESVYPQSSVSYAAAATKAKESITPALSERTQAQAGRTEGAERKAAALAFRKKR